MRFLFLASVAVCLAATQARKIDIRQGTFLRVEDGKFMYGNDHVYLSGTNPAWINYGNDFGNNQWEQATGQKWTEQTKKLGDAHGNSIRVWIHIEGEQNPAWDNDGYVTGTDPANTLIPDLRAFLDVCQENGIFLNLVLWNGAVLRPQRMKDLFYDDAKLQSYIDNALIPMVRGLKDHPALGAWEVMNEPEGSSPAGQTDSDPCFDFTHLGGTKLGSQGPGWTGANIPIKNILRFHNWIADAIHTEDPKALVNVGSWSPAAQAETPDNSDNQGCFNHYKADCLKKAGGRDKGYMDFWQFHSYYGGSQWYFASPFQGRTAADYGLDGKPVVVGEFPTLTYGNNHAGGPLPDGATTQDLVEHLYSSGFAGGWTWFYGGYNPVEEDEDIREGTAYLAGRTENGKVDFDI